MSNCHLRTFLLALFGGSALLLVALAGWRVAPNGIWGLYTLTDGALAAWNSESIFQWSAPFDPSPYNLFQGLGSLYLPNTPWLNPGALILSLPADTETRYYLSYTIYFIELFASTVLLGRALRLPAPQSILGAQLLCLVLFPPFSGYFVTLPWMSLAPFNAHLMALLNVMLVLFLHLGAGPWRRDLAVLAGLVACVVGLFYTAEVTMVTYAPFYGLCFGAVLAAETHRRAQVWKIGAAAVLVLLLAASGISDYYLATAEVTSSHLMTALEPPRKMEALEAVTEGVRAYDWCASPQVFLCSSYPVRYFHAAALLGAVLLALLGRGLTRIIAAVLLVYAVFYHAYAVAAALDLLSIFNRINKDYLVFASYPVQALTAVAGPLALYGAIRARVARTIGSPAPASARRRAMAVAWLSAAALVMPVYGVWALYRFQPQPVLAFLATGRLPATPIDEPIANPITAYLAEAAALHPGAPYEGLTAAHFAAPGAPLRRKFGADDESPSVPELYVESRHYLEAQYGNRFMMTDLWRRNIPTFEEYGQWITKPLMVFTREMLARPDDLVYPWETHVYALNVPLMAALGIRYVVTDSALSDERLVLRASHVSREPVRPAAATLASRGKAILQGDPVPLRLYELRDPNLGTYSPVELAVRPSAAGAFELLRAPDFSPRRTVVLHEHPGEGPFVPVSQSTLSVDRGIMRVSARSSGRSLLLLPVQYSRCLALKTAASANQPQLRLMRANVVQAALLFERSVDAVLSFEFGPLRTQARCRLADVADYEQLDFSRWRKWPGWVYRKAGVPEPDTPH